MTGLWSEPAVRHKSLLGMKVLKAIVHSLDDLTDILVQSRRTDISSEQRVLAELFPWAVIQGVIQALVVNNSQLLNDKMDLPTQTIRLEP